MMTVRRDNRNYSYIPDCSYTVQNIYLLVTFKYNGSVFFIIFNIANSKCVKNIIGELLTEGLSHESLSFASNFIENCNITTAFINQT